MKCKHLAAALSAAVCLISCAACGKGTELSVNENVSVVTAPTATNAAGETVPTVGDIVEPSEDSEEYSLRSYRVASDGVKFYYDEPITVELMFALNSEQGTTLILVTHDASIAARCQRRLHMEAGNITADDEGSAA